MHDVLAERQLLQPGHWLAHARPPRQPHAWTAGTHACAPAGPEARSGPGRRACVVVVHKVPPPAQLVHGGRHALILLREARR